MTIISQKTRMERNHENNLNNYHEILDRKQTCEPKLRKQILHKQKTKNTFGTTVKTNCYSLKNENRQNKLETTKKTQNKLSNIFENKGNKNTQTQLHRPSQKKTKRKTKENKQIKTGKQKPQNDQKNIHFFFEEKWKISFNNKPENHCFPKQKQK